MSSHISVWRTTGTRRGGPYQTPASLRSGLQSYSQACGPIRATQEARCLWSGLMAIVSAPAGAGRAGLHLSAKFLQIERPWPSRELLSEEAGGNQVLPLLPRSISALGVRQFTYYTSGAVVDDERGRSPGAMKRLHADAEGGSRCTRRAPAPRAVHATPVNSATTISADCACAALEYTCSSTSRPLWCSMRRASSC